MLKVFPTGQSFQRLNNCPLDNTYTFDTLIEAEEYAIHNKTAYIGQIIYIKDARSTDESGEGVENYDGLFIIDHYKTLRPLFKFILSTLKTDSGSGLTSDGIHIDTTDVKEMLDINENNSEDIEEIRNTLEILTNNAIECQNHLNNYQSDLDLLQENIDNHTHSADDIRNLETKLNEILQDMDIESGVIDEEALKEILRQNGYASSEDIDEIIRRIQQLEEAYGYIYDVQNTCVEKIGQIDTEINNHQLEYESFYQEFTSHVEEFSNHVEEFLNHFHTISQIKGDNEGDDDLRTELDKDQQDLADFKVEIREEIREELGTIAELLDEINGEII